MLYGIEIELLGHTVNETRAILKRHLLTEYFIVKFDGSLIRGAEITTRGPIELNTQNLLILKKLFEILKNYEFRNHYSCGIHIHVDARSLDLTSIKKITNLYMTKRHFLYNRLNKRSVFSGNNYSRRLTPAEKATFFRNLKQKSRYFHGCGGKLRDMNLYNLRSVSGSKKTIEFRLFDSTTDFSRMLLYLKTVDRIVKTALSPEERNKNKLKHTIQKIKKV